MATSERTQTIAFIRHGVALHNLRVGNIGPDLTNAYFFDPPLVPYGVQQAADAGEKLRQWLKRKTGSDKIGLVLTSPLTRCFQSTWAVLGLTDEATTSETTIVCLEDLREAYGLHFPDKRREKSVLMVSVVVFSLNLEDSSKIFISLGTMATGSIRSRNVRAR